MFRLNLWTRPFFQPQPHLGAAEGEMENSSFLPNPLTSPALMVLASTAADSSRDSQRLQGNHQYSPTSGDKDLPIPFPSSYPMFRQGDHFPPLYTPMHMPFVQPSVSAIGRSGSGAFRPLPQGDDRERDYHHSAFIPTKRSKHEDSFELRTSPDTKENGDHHLDSPGNKDGPMTPNSITYELSSETFSESGESQDRSTPDAEGRNLRRQRKRTFDGQFPCCPVCGITLRVGEMESHFAAELEKLDKISKNGKRIPSRESTPQGRKVLPSPSCSSGMRRGKDSPGLSDISQSRVETYLRVKSNRQARLSAKTRGKKKKCQEETVCPVCTEKVFGNPEELNEHVELCLKRMQQEHEETEVDVEGNYEEYTWAGQTRIRATTMLEGGFKGLGFKMATKREEDEDINLDVDGDDSDVYGKPQYGEKDIIPCSMEDPTEQKEMQALRGAYLKTEMNSSSMSSPPERNRWSTEDTSNVEGGHSSRMCESTKEYDNIEGSRTEIIESLRIKIKTQTKAGLKGDKHKCLICMEPYTVPLTSIQCWHVHCEECWLRTLGAKKLCPQCNTITSPADLRRIYF